MIISFQKINIMWICCIAKRLYWLWIRQGDLLALVITVPLLFLLGCSHTTVNPNPLPAIQDYPSEYRIKPGDEMEIKFFYNPELNESVTVRPDGRISLQLASNIPVAGLTPVELTQRLKKSYARELNQPEITVIMRTFVNQRIYVDGEVNTPSLVPLSAAMTVLQSITVAGGLKESAKTNNIHIIRQGPKGKPEVFTIDLTQFLDGTDLSQNTFLRPLDIVFVPRKTISKVNVWVDQYLRRNIPIGIGFGYSLNN
jgi:protein involved in polysaccharide export with SLBB domain